MPSQPPSTASKPLIAEALADYAARFTYDAIPTVVRDRAKHLMLDAIGIALASTRYDFAKRALAASTELGSGTSQVIGMDAQLALRDAILMNGVLIHGLDYDDTHARGVIHATASVLPTVMAVAADTRASGKDLLSAYVLGMEIATRLASVAKGGFHQVGFHPTGLIGAFSSALVTAKLQNQSAAQMAMAQGIALSMASGNLEFLQDGAWTKRLHPGWAGVAGVTAATYARHGFIGPRAVYEGRFGLYNSHLGERAQDCDLGLATADLGQVWELTQVAVKPLPACHFTHACADSAIALHERAEFDIAQIKRIRALVPAEVIGIVCEPVANKRRPQNSYDAQFSIPYAVASGLLRGRFGLAEQEADALKAADVLALAAKVDYEADPDSGFPRHYSGEVIVELNDGREFRHREAINRGAADRPLSNADIVNKFMENTALVVSAARAEQIRELILNVDSGVDALTFSRSLVARA
ncbi:MmgE/PrpD family protein [Halopseudomonas pelagia]|uniref:2-methylcitrate dehydratase n=1 Tax=Halopseudomonas pelagia TaxID=553151 RepID=A0AA91U142_9GAMM|nr:MmgE/PrpD family protein [Halopseudomonas pelagia]PCC98592.1 2-methylcitrate dehydratase [Halopseudomonas pelagia]QFY55554.1 MmgE/PrpD family protein [Halopseudomonas pelagia]